MCVMNERKGKKRKGKGKGKGKEKGKEKGNNTVIAGLEALGSVDEVQAWLDSR
jgi:hypothetical protein